MFPKIIIPPPIMFACFRFIVSIPIDFENETLFCTEKIRNVWSKVRSIVWNTVRAV